MRMSTRRWLGAPLIGALVVGAGLVGGCASRAVPSYDPCTPGQTCEEPRSTCVEIVFTSAEASMCTVQRCVLDQDCPLDARGQRGACLEFEGALPTCFEACERLSECATGWSCEEVTPRVGMSRRVCVPAP